MTTQTSISMEVQLIADGLVPEEHERHMRYISYDEVACPWCDLTVTVYHGQHTRCDRDHIMFLQGATLYVWTREAESTRRIRMDLLAEERVTEEDRIAREHGFGVLGAYILANHPSRWSPWSRRHCMYECGTFGRTGSEPKRRRHETHPRRPVPVRHAHP